MLPNSTKLFTKYSKWYRVYWCLWVYLDDEVLELLEEGGEGGELVLHHPHQVALHGRVEGLMGRLDVRLLDHTSRK